MHGFRCHRHLAARQRHARLTFQRVGVIDWVVQAFGGGTNNDVGVASAYAMARMLRLADGPDEVHRNQIAKIELEKHA